MDRRLQLGLAVLAVGFLPVAPMQAEAIWQWSVPMDEGRAFLWIPEDCAHVRGVLVAQHNMIEQGILEHRAMRGTLSELGLAEVFIAPPFDRPFQFDRGAGERFDAMMHALADESGYDELEDAPVVPMGHSACASFPWNFAAWSPGRTLAVLSVKGDAPQTTLTGSGAPNPEWGARRIDGIPGLMVMSEQEWWEARLAPLLDFRATHPATPLAVLTDTGHGHFDATDELVGFLALFIRKSVDARLPVQGRGPLRPVDPAQGWLVGRWHRGGVPRVPPVSTALYHGDPTETFWCLDQEMAQATEAYHARGDAMARQQVSFEQAGRLVPIASTHAGVELQFLPDSDGVTFLLNGAFIEPLPPRPPVAAKDSSRLPPPTTTQPTRAADGDHASGPVDISPITGPVERIGPDVFRVAFNRTSATGDHRDHDIWFLARHPGDATYKGSVQQALLRLPRIGDGVPQEVSFPMISDRAVGAAPFALGASSDAGMPVGYFVREGPAYVQDGVLHLTPLPPRSRLPVRVTVVAWQFGRLGEPGVRAARPVERTFLVNP